VIRYEIEDVDYWCRRCDSAMERTDCTSPHCAHNRCLGCRAGCDIELDDGLCMWAVRHARPAVDVEPPPYAQTVHAEHVTGGLL
jgi:hypothetical protein